MWLKVVLGVIATLFIALAVLISQVNITPGIMLSSLFGEGESVDADTMQSRLSTAEGFTVGLYAANVRNARFIEFTEAGDLIVAQPRESSLTLLERDRNGDGRADGQRVLMDGLVRPHSIDFHDGYLYIGESTAVGRIRFDHESGSTVGDYERIITGLDDSGNHWTKTIRFGPDGLLYLSSGSTCNVCLETDDRRAAITRYQPDGSGEERFATGLRNSVGMDWAPFDGQLYATDNGRDLLGDDYPPCELNRVEAGKFYGWPYVNGFGDADPDFGDEEKMAEATSPVHGFRAHNAPLGIRFIDLAGFPDTYRNAALVALHGSWNRSSHDGYKVVSLHHREDGSFEEKDFLSGFEKDGDVIGRPVDVAAGPDDCVYISDDYSMSILKVCYGTSQGAVDLGAVQAIGGTGLEHLSTAELASMQSDGKHLFETRGCIACHTAEKGDPSFGLKPLQKIADRYNVDSLRAFFKTPTPPMPPVRLGSDEEEVALTAYLLSL